MSYRTHGIEDDDPSASRNPTMSPSTGAPSPYTPGSDQFFFSPTSPSLPEDRHYKYSSLSSPPPPHPDQLPHPSPSIAADEERTSASSTTVGSKSTTQYLPLSSRPPAEAGPSATSPAHHQQPQQRWRPWALNRRTSSNCSRTEEMLRSWSTGVHWYVPTSMLVVFILGCAGAVGHHLFYSYLNGRPAKNQLTMNRYGTAFAFFTKASLVGSVVLAYRQRMWYSLREKPVSLRGLDALFSVVEDPSWFILGPEIFLKARVASAMALATWFIPLASVLSPGSLTTQLVKVDYPGQCAVNNINFTQEADADWRHPRRGRPGYNLAFFNTTPPPPGISVADWYDEPSMQCDRITQIAFLSNQIVAERSSPCPGYNCTYQTEFYGPWYNCSKSSFSDPALPSAFNISDFVPAAPPIARGGKNFIYKSQTDDNSTKYPRPYPNYNSQQYTGQGIFQGDPDVWLAFVENTMKPVADVTPDTRWKFEMVPAVWRCVHQKAKYVVRSRWSSDNRLADRTATVSDGRSFLAPGEHIGPRTGSMGRYKEFIAYYAVGSVMRVILNGDLVQDGPNQSPVTHSEVTKSALLVDQSSQYPIKDFIPAFQRFYEGLVMSFISEGYLEIAKTEDVSCLRTRLENRFRYLPRSLWIGYAIAIAVALCSIVTGIIALWSNGFCSDTTFSKIMVTTRNPTLDKLVRSYPGVALGGDPMPKELDKTQLRFGVIQKPSGEEGAPLLMHTAFGLANETGPINRHDVQAALKVRTDSEIELGNRGMFFPGTGLGALPG